jgi:predicted acyltransferase
MDSNTDASSNKAASAGSPTQSRPSSRLLSLDALRGLSIIIMLLVNNFGPSWLTPTQLRHAGWTGIHLADMAFPWFLFCVGVAIPFSVESAGRKGVVSWRYDLRALRRVLILIALGALLDITGDYPKVTFFSVGVLQTIALSYAVGVLLHDLSSHRRLLVATLFLAGYWAAIKFLPVPGMGVGAFEEKRNFILHLNRTYLGQVGLWNLSRVVPTSALVLIATAIGDMMRRSDWDRVRKATWLMISGALLVSSGFIWSLSLPFSKWAWTPSYVLLSAGTACLVLGVLDWMIDIAGWRRWASPLIVFGSNAILAYVLPVLSKPALYYGLHIRIEGWAGVLPFILFWWLVMWVLYKKRWFLKV